MALAQDFSKYGMHLVNINGTYFIVETGGYGQTGGAASVDPSTAQQLIGQGVQQLVIPQQDADAQTLATKYGLNFSTSKGTYSLADVQNRIANGYVPGEKNQTMQDQAVQDAKTANAALAANPPAAPVDKYANDPNMVKLPDGTYVPKGSAGALNETDPNAYAAKYGSGSFDAQGNPIAAPTTSIGTPYSATATTSVPLKNPGIAQANPATIANPSYINALYQEAYGRNATQEELNRFATNTVKDAANLILGAQKSPFSAASGTTTPGATNTGTAGTTGNGTSMTNTGTTFSQAGTGGVTRNMAAEQAFVNAWNGKGGRMPTADEINMAVYGTAKPEFNTAQGTAAIQKATGAGGTTGTTGTTSTALQQANALIDGSNLSPELKTLYKQVVAEYPDKAFNTAEILNTFNKIKTETIDPHYYELANTAQKDFSTSLAQLNQTRQMQQESDNATAGQNIRQAVANNEKAGMTFTGKAIQDLGAGSAYAQTQGTNVVTPAQTPFGGMFYEGTVNQANRLMATSNAANYNKALQELGRSAEDKLGTTGAAGLGINYSPAGGVTSSLDTEKQQKYATTLSRLYNNSQAKSDLNTDVPIK